MKIEVCGTPKSNRPVFDEPSGLTAPPRLPTPCNQACAKLRWGLLKKMAAGFSTTGGTNTVNIDQLSFRAPELGEFVVEAEVVWTRTAENGTHETGCRIIRKMIAPSLFATQQNC